MTALEEASPLWYEGEQEGELRILWRACFGERFRMIKGKNVCLQLSILLEAICKGWESVCKKTLKTLLRGECSTGLRGESANTEKQHRTSLLSSING